MKNFILIAAILFSSSIFSQDCYQKAAGSFSVSYGYHHTGSVISLEGGSWGIERRTSFYLGALMYQRDAIWQKDKDSAPVSYKQGLFDGYVKIGLKLNNDE